MKIIFAVLLGLGASLSSSLAQLAIYNFTSSQTIVGSGFDLKTRGSGILIIDLVQDRAVRISKFKTSDGRQFAVADEPNFKRWHAVREKGVTTVMVSRHSLESNGIFREGVTLASGKEALVNIGPSTASLPKTLKGTGYTMIDFGGSELNGISTFNMLHSFSAKQTTAANAQNETLEQAVGRWRQILIDQGYADIDEI